MKMKSAIIIGCLIVVAVAVLALFHARRNFVGIAGSPTVEGSRAVADDGVKIMGWKGKVDAAEEKADMTINDARLAQEGNFLHITTGPAVTYWKSMRRLLEISPSKQLSTSRGT